MTPTERYIAKIADVLIEKDWYRVPDDPTGHMMEGETKLGKARVCVYNFGVKMYKAGARFDQITAEVIFAFIEHKQREHQKK